MGRQIMDLLLRPLQFEKLQLLWRTHPKNLLVHGPQNPKTPKIIYLNLNILEFIIIERIKLDIY